MAKFLKILFLGLLSLWIAIILVIIGGNHYKNTSAYWNVAPWLIMVSIPVCVITLVFSFINARENFLSLFKNDPNIEIPNGVKSWSWGAFLLNWIWAIGNRTWIGLLVLIPYIGFAMAIILGIKGREWAWKNTQWESVEHFNHVQKRWSFWGVLLIVISIVMGFLGAIVIPAYQNHALHAKQVEIK